MTLRQMDRAGFRRALLRVWLCRLLHDGRRAASHSERNPIWPSTFPKILTVLGIIVGLIVLFHHRSPRNPGAPVKDGNHRYLPAG